MATALPAVAPHEVAGAWNADLPILLGLLALAGLYAHGLERLRLAAPRRGPGRAHAPVAPRRVRAFAAGWLALFVALASPLHALGHTLLTAHMVQHLLLMIVAPPLLIAGRPVLVSSRGLPDPWRRRIDAALGAVRRRPWRAAPVALAIWTLHLGVLWAWHVPRAYEAALGSTAAHALEHLTMLGAALAFWWAVLRRGVLRYGAAVVAVTVTAAGSGALAALLTFAEAPWYRSYDPASAGWPLTALDDQHLAAALMWVAGGLAYAGVGAVLFVRWLHALERRAGPRSTRSRIRPPQPGPPLAAALLVVVAVVVGACRPETAPGIEEGPTVARGRQAVDEYGCIACHVIEGYPAPQGRVGPSLHDVTSRRTLAGNLPNTPENLRRWIQEPQEIDPGNLMPDLGVTDTDAAAIVRYLNSLEQGAP